jgi:hypothetical protein
MTLREVEATTGVPVNDIILALKLPPAVSPDQRLGVLKRTYGFEINDVRDIVRRLMDNKK